MMIKFLDLQKVTAKYADEIHDAVLRVIDSGWYLQGEENRRFEADYARYIGTKYAIGCANGLDPAAGRYRSKRHAPGRAPQKQEPLPPHLSGTAHCSEPRVG